MFYGEKMVRKYFVAVILLSVIAFSSFAQNDSTSQNSGGNSIREIARETLGLYVQYRRIVNAVTYYWEDEIGTGLTNGKYIDNRNNSQYLRIKNIFDGLLRSQRLTRDLDRHNWRIYLQNSNEVNAFAALNGIIIINRGIIEFCQNDDELALIIGHEMAHMTQDHVKKQLRAGIVMDSIIERLSSIIARIKNRTATDTEEISDNEISDRELFQLIFGLAGELALLKYSRAQEVAADEIGAMYAADVGYDTNKGFDFWQRMASISNNSRWLTFLSTHPFSEQRALTFLNGE
jgi:predicted Zn-dependent protease